MMLLILTNDGSRLNRMPGKINLPAPMVGWRQR